MKKSTLLLLLTFINFQLKAQKDTLLFSKKHEINIGFFNAFNLQSYNSMGIGYKYHTAKGAYRIASSYNRSYSTIYNSPQNSIYLFKSKTNNLIIEPRIGFEWHEYFKKLLFYYGADLKVKLAKYESDYEYNNGNDVIEDYLEFSKRIDRTSSASISPFIGLKYQFNRRFSISTETALNFINSLAKLNISDTYYRGKTTNQRQTTNDNSVSLSSLGTFSLNIHF